MMLHITSKIGVFVKDKVVFILIVQRQQLMPIVQIGLLLVSEIGIQVKDFRVARINFFQLPQRGTVGAAIT